MNSQMYLSRAGYSGSSDPGGRAPELAPLAAATISVFGLGAIGAVSALEFARAGVGAIRILDFDFVDPATVCRWPLGLSAAGLLKADVIKETIERNYPSTAVTSFNHRIGVVRLGTPGERSDPEVIAEMTRDVSLIYDASAELGVHHYLSDVARKLGIPYICVSATLGGWGGTVLRIIPGKTEGCWLCYCHGTYGDGTIPTPPFDPNGEVQPAGCADPTFTGAGFDLADIALAGVRMVAATLCGNHANTYPSADWDLLTIAFRSAGGKLIPPNYSASRISRHRDCPTCASR